MTGQLAYSEHMERLALSLKHAHARHGHDEFKDAYCAFLFEVQYCGNRRLWRRLMRSKDMGEALVQWHRMSSGEEEDYHHA